MSANKAIVSALGIVAVGAATVLFLLPCPSSADDESALIGDVAIDHVAATPARAGEITRVTFSIGNSGSQRVMITGIRLSGGELSRVIGFYGTSHSGDIGAFPVSAGDTAQLDGKKAWIEVGPLKQDLGPDTIVSARLVLGPYEAPISIHVSPASPDGSQRGSTTGSVSSSGSIASGGLAWLRATRC